MLTNEEKWQLRREWGGYYSYGDLNKLIEMVEEKVLKGVPVD